MLARSSSSSRSCLQAPCSSGSPLIWSFCPSTANSGFHFLLLQVVRLGVMAWDDALKRQQEMVAARIALRAASGDSGPDTLLLVQHPPTYTSGRSRVIQDHERARLSDLGAAVFQVPKGNARH